MIEYVEANRANWDERVADHLVAYRANEFADDPTANGVLGDLDLMAPHLPGGSVAGLDLVHLQCHIGLDTLSWARLGARATGTDFSGEAVVAAKSLATRAGLNVSFVQTTNEGAATALKRQFDIVYTSVGVLTWLHDLQSWAKAIDELLRPGGLFLIREGHPMMSALADERDDDLLVLDQPYFPIRTPRRFDDGSTYASENILKSNKANYQWSHSLAEIFSAILGAGLTVLAFDEHITMPWKALPSLVKTPEGFALPDHRERLPLMFSLVARKPAST